MPPPLSILPDLPSLFVVEFRMRRRYIGRQLTTLRMPYCLWNTLAMLMVVRNVAMLECSERLPVVFSSHLLFSPSWDHSSVMVHLDGGAIEPGAKLWHQPESSCPLKALGVMWGGGTDGSVFQHTLPTAILSL
uniref:Uncharacterized protein n=1 Tax=Micrurus paraensis TaxID=1970185 RepID=A0A2D4KTI9_9SAUR